MLTSFQFSEPAWLLLFFPIAILMYGLWRNRVSAEELAGEGIIAAHLAKTFSMQNSHKTVTMPIILTLICGCLIVLSLSGPSWVKASGDSIKAPLVIGLDLSPSMLERQQDIEHLTRAKLAITTLLQYGSARPISLVAFSGSSHQVLPPSDQFALLTLYLGYLSPEVMPVEGDEVDSLVSVIKAMPEVEEFGFDLLIFSDGFTGGAELLRFVEGLKAQVIFAALTTEAETEAKEFGYSVMSRGSLTENPDRLPAKVANLEQSALAESGQRVNYGYWLLYPAALVLLLFFRKGFSLYWASAIVLCVSMLPAPAQANWLDWFFSDNQQAQYYYNQGDYQTAAILFTDPHWKAQAYYQAKEYSKAAKIYRQQNDLQSLFNLAMTYTRGRNYSKAQSLYQLLIEIDPNFPGAERNLRIVSQLIRDIKQLGESQQEENPPESIDPDDMTDPELGADKPQMGKITVEIQQLSVEELLNSETKKQQWLTDISKDPQQFLAAKFQAEYNRSQLQRTLSSDQSSEAVTNEK